MAREDEIRLIAFQIWQAEDCCDGHDLDHWLRAEVIWMEQQKQEAEPSARAPEPASQRRRRSTAAGKKTPPARQTATK